MKKSKVKHISYNYNSGEFIDTINELINFLRSEGYSVLEFDMDQHGGTFGDIIISKTKLNKEEIKKIGSIYV